MSTNGTLYVSRCPLSLIEVCHWESDPGSSEEIVREALRAHVNGYHRHSDLVEFAAAHADPVVRYEQSRPWNVPEERVRR